MSKKEAKEISQLIEATTTDNTSYLPIITGVTPITKKILVSNLHKELVSSDGSITRIECKTLAEYTAIEVKSPTTLYIIKNT